jgi:hypothetical protein
MSDSSYHACLLLAKPRRIAAAFAGDSLPPGLVGVLTARPGFTRLTELSGFLAELPSYIPLVATAEPALLAALHELMTRVGEALGRQIEVFPQQRRALPTFTDALALINTRPQPSGEALALQLAARLSLIPEPPAPKDLDPADLSAIWYQVILEAIHPNEFGPPDRTRQWRTRQLLSCRPSDLRRLVALARQARLHSTVDSLAAEMGTTAWRLGQRTRALLGISAAEYNAMAGWEPILEAAVRHGLGHEGWGRRAGGQAGRRAGAHAPGGERSAAAAAVCRARASARGQS